MKQFAAKLTEMFEQVEPAFREATIARYRLQAQSAHDAWVKRLEGPEPTAEELRKTGGYFRVSLGDLMRVPQYTKRTRPDDYISTWNWESLQKAIAEGHFAVDLEKAEKDANFEVTSAKEHFIAKQTKKLSTATQRRADEPKLSGTIEYRGVITGVLTAVYKNDDSFDLVMSITHNNRQGRGYLQFPSRFTNIHFEGRITPKGPFSEKWMSENFKC